MCCNGAIGLFLHKKLGGTFIEVELQPRNADMARRSVELSSLPIVIRFSIWTLPTSLRLFPKIQSMLFVQSALSVTAQSRKNPNHYLAIARHEIATNLETVAEQMSGLLKMNGHGYLVHRPDRLTEF
ncbi:MAG: hypothetical protein ACLSH6_07180 [Limosilactobacillus pontis]